MCTISWMLGLVRAAHGVWRKFIERVVRSDVFRLATHYPSINSFLFIQATPYWKPPWYVHSHQYGTGFGTAAIVLCNQGAEWVRRDWLALMKLCG